MKSYIYYYIRKGRSDFVGFSQKVGVFSENRSRRRERLTKAKKGGIMEKNEVEVDDG